VWGQRLLEKQLDGRDRKHAGKQPRPETAKPSTEYDGTEEQRGRGPAKEIAKQDRRGNRQRHGRDGRAVADRRTRASPPQRVESPALAGERPGNALGVFGHVVTAGESDTDNRAFECACVRFEKNKIPRISPEYPGISRTTEEDFCANERILGHFGRILAARTEPGLSRLEQWKSDSSASSKMQNNEHIASANIRARKIL
jgi:hypothetical protein